MPSPDWDFLSAEGMGAVLALSRPGGLIVCNGYKDREYIRLALIGRKLGLQTQIVVEKLLAKDGDGASPSSPSAARVWRARSAGLASTRSMNTDSRSKISPFAVRRPWKADPYQEARPTPE